MKLPTTYKYFALIAFIFVLAGGCEVEEATPTGQPIGGQGSPTVTTNAVSDISTTGAISGGNVTNTGDSPVTARGIVWSTSSEPTVSLATKTSNGSGTGTFTAILSGLSANTTYFVRAYATNSEGTAYGTQLTFKTLAVVNNLALNFDGTDDFVEIPDKAALRMTSRYTLEAWIKIDTRKSLAGIISKYHTSNADGYTLRLSNGSPFDEINFDGVETTNANLSTGVWYHIAAVNNLGTRTIYINGVQASTTGVPEFTTAFANTDPLKIGVDFDNRYFDGTIDDVRVWNVARTAQQISESRSEALLGNETGLVAYHQFKSGATAGAGNSGITQATDQSNGGNNGTLMNFGLSGTSSNWVTNVDYPVAVTYQVGDALGGGIIAYVDGTGEHGLIAAPSDQSAGIAWSNGNNTALNTSTDLGTGAANTDKIVNHHGASGSYAAELCKDLVLGGFDDWYLPSREELKKLYLNRVAIGGFSEIAYWSSSNGNGASDAWGVFFGTGTNAGLSFVYFKTETFPKVRAVRSF